jgi:hypothetical protein
MISTGAKRSRRYNSGSMVLSTRSTRALSTPKSCGHCPRPTSARLVESLGPPGGRPGPAIPQTAPTRGKYGNGPRRMALRSAIGAAFPATSSPSTRQPSARKAQPSPHRTGTTNRSRSRCERHTRMVGWVPFPRRRSDSALTDGPDRLAGKHPVGTTAAPGPAHLGAGRRRRAGPRPRAWPVTAVVVATSVTPAACRSSVSANCSSCPGSPDGRTGHAHHGCIRDSR